MAVDLPRKWVRSALRRRAAARAARLHDDARRAGERLAAEESGAELPAITVVTPSLNQARFLSRCIDSVLEQGYPKLEYVVIDGASTDASVEIIRRYEQRIAWWTSEPDRGQSDALNKAFRRANGDLVAWLNADDYYLPGALFAAARAQREHPGAAFYFGDGFRVDEEGRALDGFFPGANVAFDRDALLFGLNCILQPASFISRSALDRVGYLDPDLHYGLDTDLWIRLSAVGRAVPIRAFLAASREHAATKTASGSFARIEELRRIAEKHAGVPMTPGVLCYFLDTLDRLAAERGDVFPRGFRPRIHAFWAATSRLLHVYGARPDGFPLAAGTTGRRRDRDAAKP